MPQIAAFAASALVSASSVAASGAAAIIAAGPLAVSAWNAANFAVIQAGVTAVAGAIFSPKVGAEGSPTQFKIDTDAGIPFAFGRVQQAGVVAYRRSFGATNRYQAVVATLSGAGPVQGNYTVSIDDDVTTFGVNDAATSGDHVGALWFQIKDGDQPDTALTSPTGLELSVVAPDWGVANKMNGRAAYMMTCFENSKYSEYPAGLPKPLVEYDGKFGYDPRLDGTYPGGVGTCRINVPSTWVYIDNPVIAALNWAIGMWEGDSGSSTYGVPYACSLVGGVGSSIDGIDVAAFVNAANVADANGWTVAALPTTKDDKFQVMTALLQAGGAYPSRTAGRISCVTYAEVQASVVTVTAEDTAGPVEVNLGQSRLERINTALPRFWSANHRWQMTQLGPVSNAAWVTEDSEIKRSRGIDFPYVPLGNQAAQLAYYAIADAREAVTGRVPFKPHMRQIAPGDCFTFAEPGFLLDGVKVKCLKRSIDPMTLEVVIDFRQETDAKHAAALSVTATGPGSVTPSGPPTDEVDDPTGFSVTVDGDEVTLNWTNGTTNYFRTLILQSATTNVADAVQVASKGGTPGAANSAVLKPGPGTWYYWVQGRDAFNEVSSEVGPATAVVTVEIDTGNLDDLNILRRTGGGTFTGDLTATEGAAWGTNLTGRPTELTDGRIAAGLASNGDLSRNIPTAILNGSNVLRYTGGGAYTGDLAATAGADWTTNVAGRPTELTDGRVGTGLNASGVLQTAIPSALADTSNILRRTAGGLYTGALDANRITNTNELTDGANLGQTAAWGSVSSRPANLASLSGSEGILNTAITLSAAGVLSGGGTSVQVNLASLPGTVGSTQVADGAIGGTKLADAAVDLASAKVTGKSLTNVDSTAATKLAGIESGAQVNPADLAALDATAASDLAAAKAGVDGLGDLAVLDQVNTAQVATNAVTVSGLASTDAQITFGENNTPVTVQALVITTTGKPVSVRWGFYVRSKSAAGFNVQVALSRSTVPPGGGSPVTAGPDFGSYQAFELSGDDILHGVLANTVSDTPPAGTTTYTLSVTSNLGTFLTTKTAEKRVIEVREHKTE